MGAAAARDPTINAGCATPEAVRLRSQIGGLIPPRTVEPEVELLRARAALASCSTALEKHRLLVTLRETNEAAFVALLRSSVEELMPIVYTPTIADACLTWGSLLPRPTGLYISAADAGRVAAVLQHWQSEEVWGTAAPECTHAMHAAACTKHQECWLVVLGSTPTAPSATLRTPHNRRSVLQ
jgi:malate dehydrogenase (oxaloacetate-decarboxylating)(NADP+)